MTRIYNDKIEISSKQVLDFFEKRFDKNDILASVMLRNEATAHIAHKRDKNEGILIKSLISTQEKYTILDIGCGCGRLVNHLKNNIYHYDGIDFTASYINATNELYKKDDSIQFYQMSATELSKEILNKKVTIYY